ncbi:MAG TPA: SLBB domain-containing protein, partial [Syntrophobacteraceae bacterium]|nr:SLBB domain-containing protein [Syntrophobacteraceae bacterium]
FVRSVPEWDLYKVISLTGEVKYPGTYTFQKGEKLSSLLSRAGGFTDRAYPKAAFYTRPSIKQGQQAQLKDMIERLERELLASGSAEAGVAASADEAKLLAEEQKSKARFVQSRKQVQAKGRLVVSLDQPDKLKNSPNDIYPEDGDSLYIPMRMDSVQIIGAVNNQTALTHREGKDYSYYVNQCGGYTKNADKGQIYVVRADGRALRSKGFLSWSTDSNQWGFGGAPIEPGDTIVVPDNLERISWMRNIKDITQILANVASSVGIVFVGLK